jgi:hypothetical protein
MGEEEQVELEKSEESRERFVALLASKSAAVAGPTILRRLTLR